MCSLVALYFLDPPLPWGGTTPPPSPAPPTSPRTRRVGGEAWPSCVRVSPARPAVARVPHPFPWQRPARPHACVTRLSLSSLSHVPSLSRRPSAAPPALQELLYQSLQALIASLTALIAFESVPSKPPQPRWQPVPSHPSCPCPAARGGARWRGAPRARPGGALARVGGARGAGRRQAWAPAGAEWHGVGGRGRWKRPFDFPILRSVPSL